VYVCVFGIKARGVTDIHVVAFMRSGTGPVN
jgi:hypothetical protein